MAELYDISVRMKEVTGFHRMRCLRILNRLGIGDHEPFLTHLGRYPKGTDFKDSKVWASIMQSFLKPRQRRYQEVRPGVFVERD